MAFDQEGEFKYTVVEQNTGLPNVTYDEEPKEIIIAVTKDQTTGDLQAEVSSDLVTVEIENIYEIPKTDISVTKKWDDADNQDGKRPQSIKVNLLADGHVKETVEVKADANGEWKYRFTGLPVYRDDVKIVYTVSEQEVAGYTATVDGFTIKNTYKPAKTSVTVTKKWDDKNDVEKIHPTEVVVKLLANGKETGKEVKLNVDNKWSATFMELDEMAAGKTIEYTVKEIAVKGYTTKISGSMEKGYVITNSHQPKGKRVPGTGDNSTLLATLTIFVGSAVTVVLMLAMRKRRSAK